MHNMGCNNTSMKEDQQQVDYSMNSSNIVMTSEQAMKGIKFTETIEDAYRRLDEEICHLESQCPGPRLATIESWVEYLQLYIENSIKFINSNNNINVNNNINNNNNNNNNYNTDINIDIDDNNVNRVIKNSDEIESDIIKINTNSITDITLNQIEGLVRKDRIHLSKLLLQMELITDVQRAMTNEEFIASISRNYIHEYDVYLKREILVYAKKRVTTLLQLYTKLRALYIEQDGLIASITGGTYTSLTEQTLDDELENARQIRDKLGNVAEQWKTCGYLLRVCAKSAMQGYEYWTLIEHSNKITEKISLALECRNHIQGSVIAFDAAQKVLPQVEIQFITQRQASAVQHANIYLLTDIANNSRYRHTKMVFQVYADNTKKSVDWFHDLFNKTLKNDLQEAEESVIKFAKILRQERLTYIKQYIGNKMYIPSGVI